MNKANTLLLACMLFSLPSFAQKKSPKIPDMLSEKHWAYIPSLSGEDGFYMARFETTVKDYRAFYMSTGEESPDHSPSLEVWNFREGWDQSKTEYYYKHPGFDHYPIVGVSLADAQAFAEWLTMEYNKFPKREFQEVLFRLPSEEEWELAARGGKDIVQYPWGSPYIRNSEGNILANILRVSEASIINEVKEDGTMEFRFAEDRIDKVQPTSLTSPVNAYWENPYGLYNMSGNVSEITTTAYVSGKSTVVAKGGSYLQTPYWAMISSRQEFSKPTAYTGFRLVMEVLEK